MTDVRWLWGCAKKKYDGASSKRRYLVVAVMSRKDTQACRGSRWKCLVPTAMYTAAYTTHYGTTCEYSAPR